MLNKWWFITDLQAKDIWELLNKSTVFQTSSFPWNTCLSIYNKYFPCYWEKWLRMMLQDTKEAKTFYNLSNYLSLLVIFNVKGEGTQSCVWRENSQEPVKGRHITGRKELVGIMPASMSSGGSSPSNDVITCGR